jgi:2-dehydropantoate 2-reductase
MLARAGVPVTLIGRAAHVEAILRDGLLLDGLRVQERVHPQASTEIAAIRDIPVVLFCVKSGDTEATARAIQPYLPHGGIVLSMQNGVDNAERIHTAAGIPAVAAVVYVAAEMTAPGKVTHSARGDLVIGRVPTTASDADLGAIAAMFERAEVPCRVSQEVRRELWVKMLMNCAYNAISALTRTPYGPIAADPAARELMGHVIEETIAVARAEGIELPAEEMIAAAHALGNAAGRALSSTAQDIVRGHVTEIDSLNGYLVRRGKAAGIPVPVNQALHTLVKLLEAR